LYDTLFGSASGTANAAAAFIWENGIERIKEYRIKTVIGSVGDIKIFFIILYYTPILPSHVCRSVKNILVY